MRTSDVACKVTCPRIDVETLAFTSNVNDQTFQTRLRSLLNEKQNLKR